MLKILRKRGEIAPEEQFLLLFTIFCYLMSDLYVKRGIRFSFRDKRLFGITEVEITRVDCIVEPYFMYTKDSVNPSLNTLFKDGLALANWALQNICYGPRDVPGCNGGKGVGGRVLY